MSRWSYWCSKCHRKKVILFKVGNYENRLSVWVCKDCGFCFRAMKCDVKAGLDLKYLRENDRLVKGGVLHG